MLKQLKKNKKKKGFTLIELVIVLAVLAIIAMIAIPNFTKVRNKALVDGDIRSAEQIEKITLMALANQDIPTKKIVYTIKKEANVVTVNATGITSSEKQKYEELLRDIENPQIPVTGKDGYTVDVGDDGSVGVGYTTKPNFNGATQGLAGTLAGHNNLTP